VAQDVIIARQLSQQGLEAMHQGAVGQAESRFVQAIEHCPTNTTARYQLANCLWQRGARHEAIEQLTKAIEIGGGDEVEMLVELGYMWANVGQLDQAMRLAEQSIRLAPEDPLAWRLRGDVFREQQDWSAALASFQRSLTYDPDNPEVQLAVAEVYHSLERPARVLATLHRLDDQLPADRQPERTLVLKSMALESLERYDEAVEMLARAKRAGRLSQVGMIRLAHAQAAAGRWGDAQVTIKRVMPQADVGQRQDLQQLLVQIARQQTADGAVRRR
jgi:tetratricopeptide (TPR) repeat protein